ncbi:hypothetical protein OEZ86_000601 [Tetradesmus obliquus]|nr:hypothetical protein OEZ86_000601 [Tetradesmus obliquus]
MTSVRRVLLETLAPAGGGKAHDRAAANPDGTLTVTPDAPDWGSPIDQLSAADSPTGFLEEEHGSHPGQLFGKFTWRIDNFAEISKRELRSHQFEVGDYKWYILVYPQGCDVCNHLSLFLCVADYDKLLPGWSHFAQFTIAVVNKDPKKSKYSDTLHRFCKKEHDWGWKKFMERGKVLGGFSVGGSLLIKAQVQVILDRPCRPFRCLDAQYRRELVRVYLTNVEALCRRFCEERRQRLAWLRAEAAGFAAWWRSLSSEAQQQLTQRVPGGPILKGLARQFFNEKEVTSSLVMDALFCGCKQLERLGRGQGGLPEGSAPPCVVIDGASASFSFALDALAVVGQLAAEEWLPSSRDAKPLPLGAEGLSLRSGGCDELSEARRDALQRDEARLAQLGRRSVEMFALAHIFTEQLERAYRHHQAEVRMADLIAEEEAAGRLQDARAAARAAADREKRAKKRERQKAKKEAERSKRDAEAAENSKQQHERHGEQQQPQEQATARLQQQEQQQQTKKAAAAGGSSDMAAAGAAAAVGLRSSSKSKLGPAEQQQHSFAGFGSQMAADTPPMFGGLPAPSKAGGAAAAAAGQLEDLAGFVHMNMIDDLLSGSE